MMLMWTRARLERGCDQIMKPIFLGLFILSIAESKKGYHSFNLMLGFDDILYKFRYSRIGKVAITDTASTRLGVAFAMQKANLQRYELSSCPS